MDSFAIFAAHAYFSILSRINVLALDHLLAGPAPWKSHHMLQVWVALGFLVVTLWCLMKFGTGRLHCSIINANINNGSPSHSLPPGGFGLPFIGETLQFACFNSSPIGHPLPFLAARKRRYGPVFKSHLMGKPALVSMDPELNKLLLTGEGKIVQAYYPSFIAKLIGPWINVHGARHQLLRSLASTRLSIPAIQSLYLNEVQTQAQDILKPWKDRPLIDAQHEAKEFIFRIILKITVGIKQEDDETLAVQLLADLDLLSTGYSSIPIDVPGTTYNKVMKARRRIDSLLKEIVRARRIKQAENADNHQNPPFDLMSVLVSEKDEFGNPLTDQEISDLIFFMLYGGFETSSVLITFLMKFLSDSPTAVDKLREEHTCIRMRKLKGTDDDDDVHHLLSWEDYKQMEFTQMVIKETLRLTSVVHYVIRESIQDIHYKGLVIPKGWLVFVNLSMVHLDPTYYAQPSTFDPWRWQDCPNNPLFLAPFGGGPRSCLGSNLIKLEAAMFIHYLVTTFRWTPMVDKTTQGDCFSGLSMPIMSNGLPIKVHPI